MSTAQGVRRALARRELIRRLRKAGALSDASAHALAVDTSLQQKVLKSMLQREVIRPGSKGGYWLDEERYSEWLRQQRLIAFGIALVMGGIVACLTINTPSHPRHAQHGAAAADSVAWRGSDSAGPRAGGASPP